MRRSLKYFLFFSAAIASSQPAVADRFSHCNTQNSAVLTKADMLLAEGDALFKKASDMFVDNIKGWHDVMKEGARKKAEGRKLKEQIRGYARQCRQNARAARNRERQELSLKQQIKGYTKAKILTTIRKREPKLYTTYGVANLASSQWQLFKDSRNVDAAVQNVTGSIVQLRALPTQPVVASWSLSGDLLRVSTTEYSSLVTDAISQLNGELSRFDANHANFIGNLRRRIRKRRSSDSKWEAWKKPFPSVSSRRTAPPRSNGNSFVNGFIQGLAGAAAVYGTYQNTRPRGYSPGSRRSSGSPSRRRSTPNLGGGRITDSAPGGKR